MNIVVDNLDSITGWTANNAEVTGLNDHSEYIAGSNSQSLIFKFNTLNGYVVKTITKDVSDYAYLVFHIYSTSKNGVAFRQATDFYYKISFGSGKEFYVNTVDGFNPVQISLEGISSLEQIKITSLHGDTDYIIVSEMLAVTDELPLDIFTGIQTRLEEEILLLKPSGILLKSNVVLSAGDAQIDLSGVDWIDNNVLILIKQGAIEEKHVLIEYAEGVCKFSQLYDGSSISNDLSSASIYLYLPITFGPYEKEIILPSMSIWGFEPNKVFRGSGLEDVEDSFNVSTSESTVRREPQIAVHTIIIDCEARQAEILALLSQSVRNFIGKEFVWVNGIKCDVKYISQPVYLAPSQFYSIIPKVQYRIGVELKEELWPRQTQVMRTSTDLTLMIQ